MKSLIFFAIAAGMSLSCGAGEIPVLRGVDELPVDRFDEYQPDMLPPYPWQLLGKSATEVDFALKSTGESPFCGNLVSGKGLVLNDASAKNGMGTGIACRFTAPPVGPVFLGFDFRNDRANYGKGVDFVCRLDDGRGNGGLILHLGENDSLQLETADGKKQRIATVEAGKWYHLGITLSGDAASVILTAAENCSMSPSQIRFNKPSVKAEIKFSALPSYTRLAFFSAGPDDRTGGWALDNICMAGKVDAPRDAWLPFNREPVKVLRESERKVYAYYYIYTSSYDDNDPGLSWYTRTVLNPTLNVKKDRAKAATELLYRPLPRPPMESGLEKREVRTRAMEEEVRLAIQNGLDGFFADFHSYPNPKNGEAHFTENSFILMDAALRVDPVFKIIPAVYSGGGGGVKGEGDKTADPIKYANSPTMKRIAEHPATLRTADGKLVISMWLTERHSPEWWKTVKAEMAKNGHPIEVVAQFNSYGKLKEFADVCYGMAHWGPRSPKKFDWVSTTRPLTTKVVFPVVMQDLRTRGCHLMEAENSSLIRGLWEQAINDKADWVFVNTWTDYTEQALAPSTFIGFFPYDLNTYYIQWFKTGKPPKIIRDTLYYVYRRNHSNVDPGKGVKWKISGAAPANEIELLAFLTEPGTLSVNVAGKVYEKEAMSGITSFKVPMPENQTFVPEFTLLRNGRKIVSGLGRYTVLGKVEFPHMLYSAGVIPAPLSENKIKLKDKP